MRSSKPVFIGRVSFRSVYSIDKVKLVRSEQHVRQLLEDAACYLTEPKEQVAAIKLIIELHADQSLPSLKRIAVKARGIEGRVLALRLIGIHRDANRHKVSQRL